MGTDAPLDASQRWALRQDLALLTDFYQLTMMGGYLKTGRKDITACFNYVFRDLPAHNGFAVAAGLEPLLDLVENLRFTEQDLAYLTGLGVFDRAFIEYLRDFRPHCTIQAVPEGTVVFPHEPIVQVEGPLIEAQLLETAVLNTLNYQTLIATKAARIRQACGNDTLVEFGLRRAQGPDGGLSGTRAAYIGGADSTSNVLAGKVYGIPVRGTHAHSWVMSFEDELSAFRAYAACYPEPILLVDTYDTLTSGLPNALRVFEELRAAGRPARAAIRLDSGDLARLSKAAYRMFTEAGFDDPLIVASNELDEDLIADLKRQGAPINSWGVGTHLITSSDHPALGGVYKLVAVQSEADGRWEPRIKLSSNPVKMTDPGRKQLLRYSDAGGRFLADIIRLEDEAAGGGAPSGRRASVPGGPTPASPALRRAAKRLLPQGRGGLVELRATAPGGDAGGRAGGAQSLAGGGTGAGPPADRRPSRRGAAPAQPGVLHRGPLPRAGGRETASGRPGPRGHRSRPGAGGPALARDPTRLGAAAHAFHGYGGRLALGQYPPLAVADDELHHPQPASPVQQPAFGGQSLTECSRAELVETPLHGNGVAPGVDGESEGYVGESEHETPVRQKMAVQALLPDHRRDSGHILRGLFHLDAE